MFRSHTHTVTHGEAGKRDERECSLPKVFFSEP